MEQNVKKREWVKTAAIIFLAVLLVLTFFSNTIMNRTLPEVKTSYVQPGSIDSKVRISGTVSARENYDVILDQSRKVASVAVKVGQEVSTGDVLFTLEPGESDELAAAQDTLRDLELSYRRALINATGADYSRENRSIQQAREALEKAQSERDALAVEPAALTVAESAVTAAKETVVKAGADVKSVTAEYKAAQYGLNHSSEGSGYTGGSTAGLETRLAEARSELTAAQNDLSAARLIYGGDYDLLIAEARARIAADKGSTPTEDEYSRLLPYYAALVAAEYEETLPADPAYVTRMAQANAYGKISAAAAAVASAQTAVADAANALNEANSGTSFEGDVYYNGKSHAWYEKECDRLEAALETAQEQQTAAEETLEEKTAALQELKNRQTEYEAAGDAVQSAENTLEELLFSLEQQKKSDDKTQQLEEIDREELRRSIEEQKTLVASLSGDTVTEVKAKVNGTVQSLGVSAGHKAEAGAILATIEVPDLGYVLTATVSAEQARLLHVGDSASVSNYYWGSKTTATLSNISPDPKDPRSSKLLSFDVSGNVDNGDSVSFAIGEKNANYDVVVPNSAIRSDTKGNFVLVITAKNSPLGNRYYASRVDVEVIASDDLNTAVSGALSNMDSVITTSAKNAPVAAGDQVRLSDTNA